jgi:hypothetical protein
VEEAQAAFTRVIGAGAEEIQTPERMAEGVVVAVVRAPGGVPIVSPSVRAEVEAIRGATKDGTSSRSVMELFVERGLLSVYQPDVDRCHQPRSRGLAALHRQDSEMTNDPGGVGTMRIGLTSIFVDDEDQAEQFYTQVLGLQGKTSAPTATPRAG